jgi:hypothetical protein
LVSSKCLQRLYMRMANFLLLLNAVSFDFITASLLILNLIIFFSSGRCYEVLSD